MGEAPQSDRDDANGQELTEGWCGVSLFYTLSRRRPFSRYLGLSLVCHLAFLTITWTYFRTQIRIVREAGVEVAIRTMPGMKPPIPPRPAASPQSEAAVPSPAIPHRKIGRIIEKKYKLDMPKIEPQAATRRPRTEDEVRALNAKNMARLARQENVDLIEIERKEYYKAPAPVAPSPSIKTPQGEYVPKAAAMVNVDVNIDYVEIPFEAGKIDLDAVKWTPALVQNNPDDRPGAHTAATPGATGSRRVLKKVKPEIPPNLGIQEASVEVILRIVISENGFVSQAEIERSSSYLEIDNSALAAVRQWIYEPAPRRDTRLVRVEYVPAH